MKKAEIWPRVPIGDFVEVLNGFPFKSGQFSDADGAPIIRIRDVTAGHTKTYYRGEIPEGYWVREGDLVVGMDGDFNSRVWQSSAGLLNQRVCKLSPNPAVMEVQFLAQILPGYLRLINEATPSVTVKHLSSKTLKETPVPVPPLPEQRRIVAKLDRLSERSAAARDHLARTIKLATRAKQAALQAAFQGRLTEKWRARHLDREAATDLVTRTPEPEQSRGGRGATTDVVEGVGGIAVNDPGTSLPDGWAWVSLRRLARQETGHTPSRRHPEWWGGDVPWIGIKDANIHHGRIIHETLQTTNEDGLANSSARLLPEGTVCLSRTASVGYVTMMGRPMATSQDFATWTCSEALDPAYLMYALMSEGEDIRRFGEGSTHTTIYFPEIRAFHIKLAPLEEQKEIVRKVRTAFARIDRMTVDASRAAHLLDRLDERLLAKAIRGELVPQNPDDEPAEALLTRIREARAAAPKAKRGRRKAR
ncbi:restriction endonuclease type I, S subunit [Cribrihabitans marinus]|nr:restriction endonuclease type I, S subunit [Cribrihabitans marinus]